ncbi:MAG: hypothetical protein ABEI52_07760 [Halobacteriaceae archaeon]
MVKVERISFVTDGHDADERLIRDYIVPSLDRLESIDGCRGVRFARFGTDPRWEKSEVKVGIYGDYEAVIEGERDRWDSLEADGLIESWSRDGAPFGNSPEAVQEFVGRCYILATKMAAQYYREFDERPAMLDEFPEKSERSVGLWVMFHVLINQMGYDADAEIDAAMNLIRSRLDALSEFHDHEYAQDRIDKLRTQLDDAELRIDELEEQGGFDYYSGPE